MRDTCAWCEEVKEIIAERDSGIENKPQKICAECANFIGLSINNSGVGSK